MAITSKRAVLGQSGLAGEIHELALRVGSVRASAANRHSGELPGVTPVTDVESLIVFLKAYQTQIMIPLELPLILRAYHHASKLETRELIGLDQALARESAFAGFASASRAAGRAQLRKLRPMRDLRVVQRYLTAVEEGRAHGWHMLVYGLVLATYSLPLRQGLVSYGWQTLRGMAMPAVLRLSLDPAAGESLLEQVQHDFPTVVNRLIGDVSPSRLLVE